MGVFFAFKCRNLLLYVTDSTTTAHAQHIGCKRAILSPVLLIHPMRLFEKRKCLGSGPNRQQTYVKPQCEPIYWRPPTSW